MDMLYASLKKTSKERIPRNLVYDEQGNVIHQIETDLNGKLTTRFSGFTALIRELLQTTVETIIKPGGAIRAYSLIFRRETYPG